MKPILKTNVMPLLFLVISGLSYFSIHATEEIIDDKAGEPYQIVEVVQEVSEKEKTDHKSLSSNLENEITKREEIFPSFAAVNIKNPKEFLQKLESIPIEENFDKVQSICWDLEAEGLKGSTHNSPNIHLSEYPEVRNNTILRSSQLLIPKKLNVIIVIDVFRAFTTACYVLESNPASYILAKKSTTISQLRSKFQDPFLIGKAERGAILSYDIPNSPTRVKEVKIAGRNILHRTEGGSTGVLMSKGLGVILAAGLVNADATVRYVLQLQNPAITIIPMGHEGVTPSLEDDICAQYIHAKLKGHTMDLTPYIAALREGSGKYFFTDDQWQYPCQDFDYCIDANRFNFTIQAEVQDEYAILRRLDEGGSQ